MGTWIYILIGVVVLGYFLLKRLQNAAGTPVLKVKIGTAEGFHYQVEFERLHPETKDIEYVRMILNFTAKVLFIIESKHNYVSLEILDFIRNISNTAMNPNDIRNFVPQGLSIREGKATGRVLEGILYFKDMRTRNIMTKLPAVWFKYQLAHSVFALIQVTVEHLDEFHREFLRDSLKFMSDSYEQGVNPREMRNMLAIPNEAFASRYM